MSAQTSADLAAFRNTVLEYYSQRGRHDLPWRSPEPDGHFDSYKILVSELMLQQTQVSRVVPKFNAFIADYPSFTALAAAPLSQVLVRWNGLGYNRRAKFLWQSAQLVAGQHKGRLPQIPKELVALPGVGPNTAGAILAYAFNQAVMFIETNVRMVFIHHFFADEQRVSDAMLAPLVQAAMPERDARQWYWALMDYGTHLKQTVGNRSRVSTAYTKQSAFHGSRRQLRGAVLRHLIDAPLTATELQAQLPDGRLKSILLDLKNEGFITQDGARYVLGT